MDRGRLIFESSRDCFRRFGSKDCLSRIHPIPTLARQADGAEIDAIAQWRRICRGTCGQIPSAPMSMPTVRSGAIPSGYLGITEQVDHAEVVALLRGIDRRQERLPFGILCEIGSLVALQQA